MPFVHQEPAVKREPAKRGLSRREEQVIGLVALGLTNRKVAEQLFLSPRTVEVHVANALRKLGLTSRRQLNDRPPNDPDRPSDTPQ